MKGIRLLSLRSKTSFVVVLTVLATVLPGAFLQAAEAAPGVHVSFTLEGCRGTFGGSFPINGPFVCPDAQYTTGNLGSGWHELDLVPHRLTTQLGKQDTATTQFTVNITADNCIKTSSPTGFVCADGSDGTPGYDRISAPVVNAANSTSSSCSVSSSGLGVLSPGVGGTDVSIYRTLTINQPKGSTCVFDYYERLALGASGFSGASLHSNLTQEDFSVGGTGARDVSIPVKGILPQGLSKTMTAQQGSSNSWLLSKIANPVTLSFANTCSDAAGARSAPVTITVTWTKLAATPNGDITVTTQVTATNPAHRPLIINVTDTIYSGTTVLTPLTGVNPVSSGDVTIAANTSTVVLTNTITVPAGTTDLNDIAIGHYTDPLEPNVVLPGTSQATASATPTISGASDNATATITDSESLTQPVGETGLTFSVATPSVGSFTNYVAGDQTTGPVDWNSGVQSDSGSVVFNKTVYVDQPRTTTGTLSDSAGLTGSEGFTTPAATASTAISTNALFDLVVSKTIPNILQGTETASFTFDVCPGSGCTLDIDGAATNALATRVISFSAGETGPTTATVGGLSTGSYVVHERPASGWVQQLDQTVTFAAPTSAADCSKTAAFANDFGPARVKVQKFTDPTGSGQEAGWVFALTGPGLGSAEQATTTDGDPATPGSDEMLFAKVLEEGTYTITETQKTGWRLTGIVGKIDDTAAPARFSTDNTARTCSFTVDYPDDAGKVFECEFSNQQLANLTVNKTLNGGAPDPADSFSFELRPQPSGTAIPCTANSGNGFTCSFPNLTPGDYKLCETGVPAGTEPQSGSLTFTLVDATTGTYCSNTFTLTPGQSLTVAVDNHRPNGGQRTIGYWKNHASCSNVQKGQQLDDFLPITIGNVTLSTCAAAVDVLSNASMKYAEHGLAAQLLGAKLNVAAGAGTCAASNNAISQGDALLIQIAWNGSSSTKIVGSNSSLRAQFVAVHDALDRYNNGLLC